MQYFNQIHKQYIYNLIRSWSKCIKEYIAMMTKKQVLFWGRVLVGHWLKQWL